MKNTILILMVLISLMSTNAFAYSRIWIGEENNKFLVGCEVKYTIEQFTASFVTEAKEMKMMSAINDFRPQKIEFTTALTYSNLTYEHQCRHTIDHEQQIPEFYDKMYFQYKF